MTYEDSNATYALNSYLWKLLEANLNWQKSDYPGAVPIIPLAQQPEFMAITKPFLIYASSVHPVSHLYAIRTESVSYSVFSKSSTEINKIINLMVETFERQDEAATDVNEWLDIEGEATSPWGISFKTIKVTLSDPPSPTEQEGGLISGHLMLEIKYSVINPAPVTNGFTYAP